MTETTEAVTDETYRARAGAMANMLDANPYRHGQKDWGKPKEENPCGTTGCVAGWSKLAKMGIVTIAPDGEMTYNPEDLGLVMDDVPETAYIPSYMFDGQRGVPTLWRAHYFQNVFADGQEWLGLNEGVATALFRDTVDLDHPEQVAVALLRRLASGELDRDGELSYGDLAEIDAQFD